MTYVAWSFKAKRFTVKLLIDQDYHYEYDGDDEDGETQEKLNSGEYVAFDSTVAVYLDGSMIGSDSLGGSVYANMEDFWTAHRDANPMNRNCSVMRATRGDNVVICHYFPGMVKEACRMAREALANRPVLRAA